MTNCLELRQSQSIAFARLSATGSRSDDVSFEVSQGEVFGFLGPNGAGKTTTVRTLGTLIAPTSGSATVAGIPLSSGNDEDIRKRIAIMPESPGLYLRLTVAENSDALPVFTNYLTVMNALRPPSVPSISSTEPMIPATPCLRVSVGASVWQGHCSAIPRFSSSTSRLPAWIQLLLTTFTT